MRYSTAKRFFLLIMVVGHITYVTFQKEFVQQPLLFETVISDLLLTTRCLFWSWISSMALLLEIPYIYDACWQSGERKSR